MDQWVGSSLERPTAQVETFSLAGIIKQGIDKEIAEIMAKTSVECKIINPVVMDGEFWFRYDGVTESECLRHDYTINHETEGIIGVMEKEAVDYVFRNRKRLNKLEQAAG